MYSDQHQCNCNNALDSATLCNLCEKSPTYQVKVQPHMDNPHVDKTVLNSSHFSSDDFPQLDGNISFTSEASTLSSNLSLVGSDTSDDKSEEIFCCSAVNQIPVIIGNRHPSYTHSQAVNQQRFLKTLKRDKKAVQGLSLPVLSNYNMRSIFPKLDSFSEDFIERSVGVSFLTEIWEKSTNKKHQKKLEEMFEMKGILYIKTLGLV